MPIYITDSRVDWGWNERSEEERTIIRTYQSQLDAGDHGVESFSTLLSRASAALPAIEIRALLEEDSRSRTLLLASGGRVQPVNIKDATRPGRWLDLPWLPLDHFATVRCGSSSEDVRAALADASYSEVEGEEDEIDVPLEYSSLDELRSSMNLVAQAMTGEPDQFVADVNHERYLVSLRPGAASIQPLTPWPSSDREDHATLVRTLLSKSRSELFPVRVSARERMAASGATKMAQALFLPEALLAELQVEGVRTDRSLSYLVQYAWKEARERIRSLPDRSAAESLQRSFADSAKGKQTLYFPGDMLAEIEDEAARFDSSASWIVQLACSIAKTAFAALPSAE